MNRPDILTKELKLQSNATSGERWLRISSNLLEMMGFGAGARFDRRVLGPGAGFEFRAASAGSTKVYTRTYTPRRNNPFETVIDVKTQDFINAAIPSGIERVHLTMRPGTIIGRPVPDRTFHIRRALRRPDVPLEAFVGLSSGVDAACLRQAGFGLQVLLECRPREKRDTNDLSETGLMTAIANNKFRVVFNEDIFRVDFNRIRHALGGQSPIALLAVAPQCDEYSTAKSDKIKRLHVENLETSYDMHYEVLRLVETISPASVLVENVIGYASSAACELLTVKLRRWGYFVKSMILDARDFGGASSRRRFYLVASVYPDFQFPVGSAAREPGSIWAMIEDQLPHCRDATHTSSLQDGITTGRVRLITPESSHAPTCLKSQMRHTKDSIYVAMPDGRYLFPNETILRRLQGLPDDFSFAAVNSEVAGEQIGQSVDWSMHHAVAKAIRNHLSTNRGEVTPHAVAVNTPALVCAPAAGPSLTPAIQSEFGFGSLR